MIAKALILVVFGLLYNAYFGWNVFPNSDAEIICDGIFCILTYMFVNDGEMI